MLNRSNCKWCGSSLHWASQCIKNPKRKIYHIGKHSNIRSKLQNARRVWFRKNPPNHQGYYVCYLCKKWLAPIETELDHVEPRSRRPDLRFELKNLRPACHACNTAKGSLYLEEYLGKQ